MRLFNLWVHQTCLLLGSFYGAREEMSTRHAVSFILLLLFLHTRWHLSVHSSDHVYTHNTNWSSPFAFVVLKKSRQFFLFSFSLQALKGNWIWWIFESLLFHAAISQRRLSTQKTQGLLCAAFLLPGSRILVVDTAGTGSAALTFLLWKSFEYLVDFYLL